MIVCILATTCLFPLSLFSDRPDPRVLIFFFIIMPPIFSRVPLPFLPFLLAPTHFYFSSQGNLIKAPLNSPFFSCLIFWEQIWVVLFASLSQPLIQVRIVLYLCVCLNVLKFRNKKKNKKREKRTPCRQFSLENPIGMSHGHMYASWATTPLPHDKTCTLADRARPLNHCSTWLPFSCLL